MILPTSYTLLPSQLKTDCLPLASGSSSDTYEGTLNGSKVCVKRVRVYTKEGPEQVTKVCYQPHHFPRLLSLTSLTDPLPGGCGVETPDTPKHRPPPRYNLHSSPACFRMDAWWGSDRAHREAPRGRPTRSRKCPLLFWIPRLLSPPAD